VINFEVCLKYCDWSVSPTYTKNQMKPHYSDH